MKLFSALLALSISLAACSAQNPRDMPLTEVNALDSATQEQVKSSLTEEEKARLMLAASAYGNDSNALNRRTLNQLIDEGEALQRNEPMYTK